MKKIKAQKGITLIALIVTVSVLVILTAVTITTVTNDEIKDKTKNTVSAFEILQEKEKLQNEVMRWDLINSDGIPTLQNYMAGIYGEENVQLNVDNSLTVTVPSGNRYIVTKDGEATLIDETTPEPEVSNISVSLDKTEILKEIKKGKAVTETIKATLNNATGKLTWFSSDPDVAQIATSEGNERIIKLKKEGTATITVAYAENKNIASICTIEVIQPVNITLDKTEITKEITRGVPETTTIAATLDVEGKIVTWSSPNTSVASIEGNGNTATVTLKAKGTATITATCGRYSATCTVTITEKPISIELDKTTITKEIFSGSTATETITATLTNAIGTVSWSSSNTSVASVVGNGNTATITFKKAGSATIRASFAGVTASCNVTIKEKEVILATTSYVGYYADLDGDAEPEGIIYADLEHSVSGQWTSSNGKFSYTTITGTKEYYISQENYAGKFGTADVLSVVSGSTGGERFYVMALEDINGGTYYTWYDAAYDSLISDYSTVTSTAFGKGKTNTSTMISKWNSSAYGAQNEGETYLDLWGIIQDNVGDGWFVPSKEEWSAFGYNLGITVSNYSSLGLSPEYWTSSLADENSAYVVVGSAARMKQTDVDREYKNENAVRMGTTF